MTPQLFFDENIVYNYTQFNALNPAGCPLWRIVTRLAHRYLFSGWRLYTASKEASNENRKENYAILFGGMLFLIIVGTISGYFLGVLHGRKLHREREQIAGILAEHQKITDENFATHPFRVDVTRERAAFLEKHGLNQFHTRPPADRDMKPHEEKKCCNIPLVPFSQGRMKSCCSSHS